MSDRPGPEPSAFFEQVWSLMGTGDSRVVRLGGLREAADLIADRLAVHGRSAWNMQQHLPLPSLRAAEDDVRRVAPTVVQRSLTSPSGLRASPLAPSFVPDLRVGPVPAPMLVLDERLALFGGPADAPDATSLWESADPAVVSDACAVFTRLWRAARPWQDVTDRPLLPARTRDVAVALADGRTDREIAADLGLGLRTTAAEVRRVVDWCGARSRGHAIALLVGAGP